MSSTKTSVIGAIILVSLLGAVFYPVITPTIEKIYDSWVETDLDTGNYRYVERFFKSGRVSFSYTASKPLSVYVMTESQFFSFQNSSAIDSLGSIFEQSSGSLSCDILEAQTVYFVLLNRDNEQVKIEYMIYYTGENISVLYFLLSNKCVLTSPPFFMKYSTSF